MNAGVGGGDSIAIGTGALAKQSDVVIGGGAFSTSQSAVSAGSVVIGQVASAQGRGDIIIGQNASAGAGGFSHNSIAIGASAVIGTGTQNLAIGVLAKVTGAAANSIVIGAQSTCSVNANIILGNGVVSATANLAWYGGPSTPIYFWILGEGDTVATPTARLIRFTNASGANNAAGNATFVAPVSTGNAAGAHILFSIGVPHGSDSALQTTFTQLDIAPWGCSVGGAAPSDNIGLAVITTCVSATPFQRGLSATPTFGVNATAEGTAIYGFITVQNVSVTMTTGYGLRIGPPSVGASATITTAKGIYVENQGSVNGSTAIGVDIAAQSGASGLNVGLRLPGGALLLATSAALSNFAGAQAATLTNSPVLGNPTKWIQVNDNGTLRNLPLW